MFNPTPTPCGRTITRVYYSVPYSFVCGTHNARFGHLEICDTCKPFAEQFSNLLGHLYDSEYGQGVYDYTWPSTLAINLTFAALLFAGKSAP